MCDTIQEHCAFPASFQSLITDFIADTRPHLSDPVNGGHRAGCEDGGQVQFAICVVLILHEVCACGLLTGTPRIASGMGGTNQKSVHLDAYRQGKWWCCKEAVLTQARDHAREWTDQAVGAAG